MGEITSFIILFNDGKREVLNPLFESSYDSICRMAEQSLRRERRFNHFQAGSLAHEVFIKISKMRTLPTGGREHFFAAVRNLIRQILIDQSRLSRAQKRGGGRPDFALEEDALPGESSTEFMLGLKQAMIKLARKSKRQMRVVELRFFFWG